MNIRICMLGLKHLCTMKQLNLESVRAVKLPIGSGELVEDGHAVTTHKVRAHYVNRSPRSWICLGAR